MAFWPILPGGIIRIMEQGWIIALDALVGLVGFVCGITTDVYRAGWATSVSAFVSDQSYRRSIVTDSVAYTGGGAFVGALVVGLCFLEGP
jgi:hypothetical protein